MLSSLPKLPLPDLALPLSLPALGDLPKVSAIPLPAIPLPTTDDAVDSYVKVGKIVLSNILSLLWKGAAASKIAGLDLTIPSVPEIPALPIVPVVSPIVSSVVVAHTVNATIAAIALPTPLERRQAAASSSSSSRLAIATPALGLPLLGGLTSGLTGGSSPLGAVASTVGGATGSLPLVGGLTSGLTGGGDLLGTVSSAVGGLSSSIPAVGGFTSSIPSVGGVTSGLTGGSSPLGAISGVTGGLTGGSLPLGAVGGVAGTVANTVGSVPVAGSAAAPVAGVVGGLTSGSPLGAVGGAVAPVAGALGGLTSDSPLGAIPPVAGAVGSAVGGALGTVVGAAAGVPAAVQSTVNTVLPGPYPLDQGMPGSDPVGGLSISIIATLLSLLKKDPLSLFGGMGGTGGLIKRDLPELADAFEIERRQLNTHEKRQASLPSLSTGLPGVGVGSLPLSGIPGVSPDLSFLVGSIAKNIAVPGGKGLGSVTGGILSVLNGIVPNFLFKLPVVQDSVPTFGCLQLLAAINPTKFGVLAGLTNLAALSQAAAAISAADLAFIRTLPVSSDPTNLITTITTLTDNILSLPGNVINLRAAVSVLCMKNLGLAVAGL
ncbi:uncharacterized protein N0V89_005120 [Didymosphaeria variabile]|uniref:Uncharacterized protein n=1 Tax=Didymosphaeria variabile TaxID=1932322 RepID=A0A9W9CA62_9PLEO|nr:uncharacterized protein N0V89_005120 [Didymosphaeria variabile]KAJ4353391.1 hypothetical protein N0V89_005120 [Didymosphaeria variabile]